jgi:hypothetical protein
MTKRLALTLAALLAFPPATFAQSAEAQTVVGTSLLNVVNSVEGLPRGTRLKLAFQNGTDVTGTVVEINAQAVILSDNQPGPSGLRLPGSGVVALRNNLTFPRAEVLEANVISVPTRYVSTQGSDAVAFRHVVRALGTNKKVDVRSADGRIRGTIESAGEDSFVVVRGSPSVPETIPYADVREIKPTGLHWGAKTAIIAGSALAAAFAILAIGYLTCGCS